MAHLIGHEGGGSLLSHLRAKGWCNFLEAGPSLGAKGFMFFGISVDLTEEGEGEGPKGRQGCGAGKRVSMGRAGGGV